MDKRGRSRAKIIFAGVHRGNQSFPMHVHENSWEVIYLWEGCLSEQLPDRVVDMYPGMFMVHPPDVEHGDVAESEYLLYHVQFEFDADPGWPQVSADDAQQSVGTTLRAIVDEWYGGEPDREEMLRILAARMNLLLKRTSWHQAVSEAEAVVSHAQGIFRKRFTEQITIDEVALAIGVSRSSLYSHFKTVLGKTPLEVLNELRLNNALFLLRHTHMLVGEIAEASGYCSASHLSHRLKESTGMSPGRVRGPVTTI